MRMQLRWNNLNIEINRKYKTKKKFVINSIKMLKQNTVNARWANQRDGAMDMEPDKTPI